MKAVELTAEIPEVNIFIEIKSLTSYHMNYYTDELLLLLIKRFTRVVSNCLHFIHFIIQATDKRENSTTACLHMCKTPFSKSFS